MGEAQNQSIMSPRGGKYSFRGKQYRLELMSRTSQQPDVRVRSVGHGITEDKTLDWVLKN